MFARNLIEPRRSSRNITSQDLGFSKENRIFINESLTQSNKKLFKNCPEVKKDKGIKFLSTSGSKIFMRKDQHEGSRVIRKIGKEMSYAQVHVVMISL